MNTSEIKTNVNELAANLGITMNAVFVPFSRSRNAGEKQPSLNWMVTIKRNGREIITTDYMQGCGRCSAYKASDAEMGGRNSIMRDEAIRAECERGTNIYGKKIAPLELSDVLYSLVSDADVIDYGTFEGWARDMGYDVDSRKAESIYRACLEIGLKLRNGIGEDGMCQLREALQDY